MGIQRADLEPFSWWLARERIGADLREHYAASRELPPQMLALVERIGGAIEGDQFREASRCSPSLLRKLDAIEGSHLLRTCRTRLRALCGFQRSGTFT